MVTITSNNKGRRRFTIGFINGFLAIRKFKYRWGFSKGPAFIQVHLGKFSVAVERLAKHKRLWTWTQEAA